MIPDTITFFLVTYVTAYLHFLHLHRMEGSSLACWGLCMSERSVWYRREKERNVRPAFFVVFWHIPTQGGRFNPVLVAYVSMLQKSFQLINMTLKL